MRVPSLLHKRKTLFCVVLLSVFSAFAADVVDLREDLRFLDCPYSYLDNNITTGIASQSTLETARNLVFYATHKNSSIKVSFLHLLPYGLRAPPLCTS